MILNEDKLTLEGLNLMLKLVSNIVGKPKEDKFRLIKKTNKVIEGKLFSLRGGVDLVFAQMGFTKADEDLIFVGN